MRLLAILALAACLASCLSPLSGASRSTVAPTPFQPEQAAVTPISGAAPILIQVGNASQVRLLDLASGRDVHAKPALALPAGEKLAASLLSADGSLLALVSGAGQVCRSGAGSELALIDPLTLQVLRSWQAQGDATWLPVP